MRLIVKNVEINNGEIYVVGSTDIGCIKGRWHHNSPPITNEIYFFELNIDEVDISEISILNNVQFQPCVFLNNEQVHFQGVCEAIDDIYAIRFTVDWIELIEIKNDNFSIQVGDGVQFSASYSAIEIFPYS